MMYVAPLMTLKMVITGTLQVIKCITIIYIYIWLKLEAVFEDNKQTKNYNNEYDEINDIKRNI